MSGQIKLNLPSGGNKTIAAPDSAATETITLPAGTKTLLATDGDGSGLSGVGKVLQVVQAVKSGGSSYQTADTWTDVSGLTLNITPSSTSSKILIRYSINISGAVVTAHAYTALTDVNNNFVLSVPGAHGDVLCHSHHNLNDDRDLDNITVEFLLSPNTTSQLTYKVRLRTQSNHTAYINYSACDQHDGETLSSITAMEIGG